MGFKPLRIAVGALLLCVPVLLAALAVPRLSEGLSIEPYELVKLAAIGGDPLAPETYHRAAVAYEDALPENGALLGWHAQFLALSSSVDSASIARTRAVALQALQHAPVDTNAWTVLCESEAAVSPDRGTRCLDISFPVTRYDWFSSNKRMSLVAYEWPYLDENLRDSAVGLILPMWDSNHWIDNSTLRWVLLDLSRTPNGRQLLLAGMAPDHAAVRDFNRWVIQEEIIGVH